MKTPAPSRRSRPAKTPLSRDVIVAAGLNILKADGFAGLTLRRIATALDTGPASLYVYFQNFDDLRSAMLEQALSVIPDPPATGLWRDRLKSILVAYSDLLIATPGLAQLALAAIPIGPRTLHLCEITLSLMNEGGVPDAVAAWGLDLLMLYVTAAAAETTLKVEPDRGISRVSAAMGGLSPVEFPNIHAQMVPMISGTSAERSAWSINVIIDGLISAEPPKLG
ncbi:MAG: TetR/AcrR family transcriptional regulator [Rhizomicrobium sp.]